MEFFFIIFFVFCHLNETNYCPLHTTSFLVCVNYFDKNVILLYLFAFSCIHWNPKCEILKFMFLGSDKPLLSPKLKATSSQLPVIPCVLSFDLEAFCLWFCYLDMFISDHWTFNKVYGLQKNQCRSLQLLYILSDPEWTTVVNLGVMNINRQVGKNYI
jgi:hypothetical protein